MTHPPEKINQICLVILAATAIVAALIFTRPVMVPLVIALFFFVISRPLTLFLVHRLKIRKTLALVVTMILVLGFLTLMGVLMVQSVDGFLKGADLYREQLLEFLTWVQLKAARLGLDVAPGGLAKLISDLPLFSYARGFTGDLLSVLGNFFLMMVFLMFMLLGAGDGKAPHPLIRQIEAKVAKYVVLKIGISMATAVSAGIVLWVADVELAVMFALITFILNFIPNIGSILATLVPLPLILLKFGFGWQSYVSFSLLASIQVFFGNLLEPKVQGDSLDLHPIAILFFLVFWGLVWGIPGMFLAVPMTAIMKIILARIDETKPFSELLAGRF